MDFRTAFEIAIAVAGFLGAFAYRQLWQEMRGLEDRFNTFCMQLPTEYVLKGDFKDVFDTIFKKLDQIEAKLDRKVDK